MAGEKRHEMMETLFGAESEDSEDDVDVEDGGSGDGSGDGGGSEDDDAAINPPYSDDEVEGGGEIDVESEGERVGSELEREESEAEREESDAEHSYGEVDQQEKRSIASERRRAPQQVSVSGSDQSHEVAQGSEQEEDEVEAQFHRRRHHQDDDDDDEDEVEQIREQSDEGEDNKAADGVAEMRDVFGDSDEEEQEPEYQHHGGAQEEEEMSGSDDEALQRGTMPDDIVAEHEEQYESEEEQPAERRVRERPVGPPLDIDIPLYTHPGSSDKMYVARVSNIMGIDSKPFDPNTYVEEEEHFITDETGHKQRIRLEDNVVRWRRARGRNGSINYESNARFVKWSDGSMQLLIGNEVLDISVQNAHHDQSQLFINSGKGILQSQGRLLQKMKFMPSSLSSKSHRLLTAIVDSRNKKMYKVKNVITNKDPEREKEEAERLQQKRIRNKEDLQKKQEKISRKYTPARERAEPQLSPGYLERELAEDDERDDEISRGHRFQQLLDEERKVERRINNVKRQPISLREHLPKRTKERRPSPPRRKEESEESEHEEEPSEYETDGQEEETPVNEADEESEEAEEEEYDDYNGKEKGWDDREDESYRKRKVKEDEYESEISPHRKPVQRRRVVVSDSDED